MTHPRYCIECAKIHEGLCPMKLLRDEEAKEKHWDAIEQGKMLPDMEID